MSVRRSIDLDFQPPPFPFPVPRPAFMQSAQADPFDKLPDEILEVIFTALTQIIPPSRYISESPNHLQRRLSAIYSIRPVCLRWKNIIDRTGQLHFTVIRVPWNNHTGLDVAPGALTPSQLAERREKGGSSIKVDIFYSGMWPKPSHHSVAPDNLIKEMQFLKQHAGRILWISLQVPTDVYNPLAEIFNGLSSLPRLEHLQIRTHEDADARSQPMNLGFAPRLTSLTIYGPVLPRTGPLPYITTLHINFGITTPEPWHTVVELAKGLELLESFSMNLQWNREDNEYNHDNQFVPPTLVPLARLKDLDLVVESCAAYGILFGSFAFPSLTRLRLARDEDEPCRIRPRPIQLPHLSKLRVFIYEIWTWCKDTELLLRNSLPSTLDTFLLSLGESLKRKREPRLPIRLPAVENLLLFSPVYPAWDILSRKLIFSSVRRLEMHSNSSLDNLDCISAAEMEEIWGRGRPALDETESFHFSCLGPLSVDMFMNSLSSESHLSKIRTFCQSRPSSQARSEVFPRPKEITHRTPAVYKQMAEVCIVTDLSNMVDGAENPLTLWEGAESLIICLTWGKSGDGWDTRASAGTDGVSEAASLGDVETEGEVLRSAAKHMLLALASPSVLPKLHHLELVIHLREEDWEATDLLSRARGACQSVLQTIVGERRGLKSGGLSYIWGENKCIKDRISLWRLG
jgi:hypothetical protein